MVVGLLLDMCFPDSSTAGSTPAKLTMELRRGKRWISPISAISCGAVFSPTPYMARTVSYSGSCRAGRSISVHITASVALTEAGSFAAVVNEQLGAAVFRQSRDMAHAVHINTGVDSLVEGNMAAIASSLARSSADIVAVIPYWIPPKTITPS